MFARQVIASLLVLSFSIGSAAPAFAEAPNVQERDRIVLKVILDKEAALTQELALLNEQEKNLGQLDERLAAAERSKKISQYIGIPVGSIGALVALIGASTLVTPTSGRGPLTGMLMSLMKGFYVAAGAAGTVAAAGSGTWVYIKSSRAAELKQAVDEARKLTEARRLSLEEDYREIQLLKSALSQ